MDRRSLIKGLAFATAVTATELRKLQGTPVIAKQDGPLLPCDGRVLAREKYVELFKLIGTNYGASDDETFNLPSFGTTIEAQPPIGDLPEEERAAAKKAADEHLHAIAVIAVRDTPTVPTGSIFFVTMKEKDLASIA